MIKRIILPLILPAMLAFVLAACDKIEAPYFEEKPDDNGNTEEVVKKVYLEEYTGHLCPNCTEGAAAAHELKEIYGKKLIVVAVHSGWFARPTAPTFSYDFRTPAGEAYYTHFGVTSNPIGMINRKEFSGSKLHTLTAWGSYVAEEMELEPEAGIMINNTYNSDNRNLKITIKTKSLMELEEDYKLVVQIVENGIVKPQKTNNSQYPGGVIEDYHHEHVLRGVVNGTWGEEINIKGSIGTEDTKTYSISLNPEWVAENCSVVAYIYNSANFEVVQAEEVKIINP